MNAEGRKKIALLIEALGQGRDVLEEMKDEEQEKFDNLSEGLQNSERGQAIELAAGLLSDAFDAIEEAIEKLGEVE